MTAHPKNTFPVIAFLGLGLMGAPMAKRLVDAGYLTSVWNRTYSKSKCFIQSQAIVANSARDAVKQGDYAADIVFTMLAAGSAVDQVIQDIIPVMKPGSILIDMSSTQQAEAVAIDVMLNSHSIGFVDAPVSGGVIGAEAGTLAIMVGARPDQYKAVEDILKVLGRPTYVGVPGTGQLAKLCNQLIVGGTINIVAEALLLAQAGGADPVAVRAALRGGFAESRILEVHGQRMLDRNFLPGGQIKTQAKDMENILLAAGAANLQLPLTEMVAELYRSLLDEYSVADHSAALLGLESLNIPARLGDGPNMLPA